VETIRTARLELIPLSRPFVDALKRRDSAAAEAEIGAGVSRWLMIESAHFVQLQLAQAAADSVGLAPLGRAMVLVLPSGRRRAIGSIGFHGPPDERGRLELGYTIEPAYRGEAYVGEAVAALFEWARTQHAITRFLISVPARQAASGRSPFEVEFHDAKARGLIDAIGLTLETKRPPSG
jgi:ribosomal-protein-alanine N-acetyltransferase